MFNLKLIPKALVIVGLLFFCSCTSEDRELIHLQGRTMGTTYNVKYLGSKDTSTGLKEQIDKLLIDINKQMSTYLKESEISSFNNSDNLSWMTISKDFFDVTRYSLTLAEKTGGLYDPTVGPLVNLWGFGPNSKKAVPSTEEIERAKERVGFKKILLNEIDLKIKKKVAGIYLDLSSVAKGFGVDKIAYFLDNQRVSNYMVEIGGEVRLKGTKSKKAPWRIAIESPSSGLTGSQLSRVLSLKNTSMATSGNYRNFFMSEGKRYSHMVDPTKGRPIPNSLASVSVVDSRGCMQADALATALMAMGLKRALAFTEAQNVAAYFIYLDNGPSGQDFASVASSKFSKLFPKGGPK